MPQAPVIKLSPAQRKLIREASGRGAFAKERIAAWRNVIECKFTFKGVAE